MATGCRVAKLVKLLYQRLASRKTQPDRETMRKFVLSLALLALGAVPAPAQQQPPGGRLGTGLPVPRYVSLKTDRVNLREGPSKDHRTAWVFQRAGLPVEIIAEYETWRRIRDSEGTDGWVLHSLLSGRRTALVMPWAKGEQAPIALLDRSDDKGGTVAQLQPGVIANIKGCDGTWCHITIVRERSVDVNGYVRQDKLWGVYPNETVE
jgi:SH3-like domain-containing protein